MTSNIEITTTPDLLMLEEIHAACFKKAWNAKDLKELLDIQGTVAAVTQQAFGLLRCIGREGEILTLAVHSQSRRQGIGLLLLGTLITYARHHADIIFLEVKESNNPAIAMYEKVGFRKVSERKKYYNNLENAVIMQLQLQ